MRIPHLSPVPPVLLLALLLLVPAGMCEAFPLRINGRTVDVTARTDRKVLALTLEETLAPRTPTLATTHRLQYDFVAVPGQAPLTLVVDFTPPGRIDRLVVEAYSKGQNPPAKQLAAWLAATLGPGRRAGASTLWEHEGFSFRLREVKNAGDDSVYGFEIRRQ